MVFDHHVQGSYGMAERCEMLCGLVIVFFVYSYITVGWRTYSYEYHLSARQSSVAVDCARTTRRNEACEIDLDSPFAPRLVYPKRYLSFHYGPCKLE